MWFASRSIGIGSIVELAPHLAVALLR